MANILICDDHPFTLMGTRSFVQSLGHTVCETCSNGISAYNLILSQQPDIALIDVSMPGLNGLELLEKLRLTPVRTRVILLTMHKEMSIFNRARALDAKGYVLKEFSTEVLEECINAVLNGGTWFSEQLSSNLLIDNQKFDPASPFEKLTFAERKILELISQQRTSREIAQTLFIAEKTVENHRSNIMKKLGLPAEKNALLLWAVQNLPAK